MDPHPTVALEAAVFWTLGGLMLIAGAAVIWLAFQGYRRNDSKPMLFMAIGFTLLIVPDVVILLVSFLAAPPEFAITTTHQVTDLAGIVAILYAIVMEP